MRAVLLLAALTVSAHAQWQMLDSHSTADFRGVDSVGAGVVWVSGTNGTVLRSEDAGYLWQHCTMPPGAEHLDFRGIQAFDANTAIVMSSGPGDQSRLYKTTDGCQTWTLLFTNPDKDGFWDAIAFDPKRQSKKISAGDSGDMQRGTLYVLGDPVKVRFEVWMVHEPLKPGGRPKRYKGLPQAKPGESAFAASNSVLLLDRHSSYFAFGTGGKQGAHWIREVGEAGAYGPTWSSSVVPIGAENASSGVFSVAFRYSPESFVKTYLGNIFGSPESTPDMVGVVVGGDYLKPDDTTANAAYTSNGGQLWVPAHTDSQPHGYRSAVAYDSKTKTWITVGPNGTDISTDDGRNWRALRPDPKAGDAPDADQHWNALSLPFVVGPHGRIGILRSTALASH